MIALKPAVDGVSIRRAPLLGYAERIKRAEEIGVFVARHQPDEPAEAKPGLERIGCGERRTEQRQEAIEEAVVLNEIARHHCIGHRSRQQLSDEAVAYGLRPAGLARRAQGFGKALGHDVGSH
jgi:hypothetical protein